METRHFRTLTVVASAMLLMFVGNAAEAGKVKHQITLITPAANAVISQNDLATGCALDPTRGYGFMIAFDWSSPRPLKHGSTYTLRVQQLGSSAPVLSQDGLTKGTYDFTECNSFVIDSNLSNWYWMVSRVDANGAVKNVSEQRLFSFAPCRLSTGAACNAP